MKRIVFLLASFLCSLAMMAQDLSQFKVLGDSLYLQDESYSQGNKYQRDAILFVDMLADTHPYYIQKERRDVLMAQRESLLEACARCESDSVFVALLADALGDLRDKHTDVIDLGQLANKQRAKQEKELLAPINSDAVMSNKGDLFHYVLLPEHKLCYLQFNQCADARTLRNEALPRWDEMLDEMFSQIKGQDIRRLVVDAQYNNGGSSMLCDELLIRLCPFAELQLFSTYLRFSHLMCEYNPRIAVAKQSWEADGHIDELYPMPTGKVGEGFVQPEVFDGQVIFVQSLKTYSSAGILMTLARDNHIGRIVGTRSSYSPSHYGEVLPYRLPNTGVIGTISCKFFARPDREHLDDKALEPDVVIGLEDKENALQEIIKLFAE